MTNTEQIRALIEAGEKATQGEWELGTHPANHSLNIIKPIMMGRRISKLHECEGGHASMRNKEDAQFITEAANSRQAISEMLEDNERMRVALKEIETYPHSNMDDDNSYAFGQCKEKAKQALKGTDDEH